MGRHMKKIKIKDYMTLISEYRGYIMGICIINVLFGHSKIALPYPVNYIHNLYWIIDIFFFFSGMGAYHSLRKNPDTLSFYRRRLNRIYLPYFPLIFLYVLLLAPLMLPKISFPCYLQEALGNILMLGWFAGLNNQLNWYPHAIMLVYLFTPALFFFIRSADGDRKKLGALAGFVLLMQLCFLGSNYVVAVARLISFLLGLLAADAAFRDEDFSLNVPLMLIVCVLGNLLVLYCMRFDADLVWRYGVTWYPGILVIPGMMLLLAWFFRFLSGVKQLKPLLWVFGTAGKYSFEIFLTHLIIYMFINFTPLKPTNNLQWVITALSSGVLAVLYGKLIDRLRKKFKA